MSNPLLTDKAMGTGNLERGSGSWAPPAPASDGPISKPAIISMTNSALRVRIIRRRSRFRDLGFYTPCRVVESSY
jgi:hypothetical protein